MRWDLVIFDCDGVLIDSELLSIRADQECLAECGIELSVDEILARYTGISFAGMVADLEARHGPLPADFADRHRLRLWPLFEQELRAIPGVTAILDSLTCRTCVASSGSTRSAASPASSRGASPTQSPGGRLQQALALRVVRLRKVEGLALTPTKKLSAQHRPLEVPELHA